jgi:hypothetical protein
VKNIDTGSTRAVVTDAAGRYQTYALAAGQYELRVEKPGFAPTVRTGIASSSPNRQQST